MSELSETLLETAFDYQTIAQTRRANYANLADKLADIALYKYLDDNTVPLGFPIKVHNRDEVRRALFDQQIYPPIHWEISDCIPGNFVTSHELSSHIMTIPCDQRYDLDDMARIADLIKKTGLT
jgi:dTDP-4-amino-4,6-dideoxygalactose transaminase